MENRRKLLEHLERYEAPLRLTTDPQALAALEQLIHETRDRLNELDSVENRSGDTGCQIPSLRLGQKVRNRRRRIGKPKRFLKTDESGLHGLLRPSISPDVTITGTSASEAMCRRLASVWTIRTHIRPVRGVELAGNLGGDALAGAAREAVDIPD